MENELRQSMLTLAETYSVSTGRTIATIGKMALNDNKFFSRLERGDGFNVKTYDRLVCWLSDNWPGDANWPATIPRPAKLSTIEAAE